MKSLFCPITGIYIPRFLLTVIAGFVFVFGFDFLVHNVLLVETYDQTPQLWRLPEEMILPWMFSKQFLMVLVSALIFIIPRKDTGLKEDLGFGTLFGLLLALLMSGAYAWMPISLSLALAWGDFFVGL
jgi:hypothetical protein